MEILVKTIVEKICTFERMPVPKADSPFISALKKYSWPGNVRELENLLERLIILNHPKILTEHLLYEETPHFGSLPDRYRTERERIIKALKLCGGNKTESAKILDMPRRTLYHKISKLGIQQEEYSGM